MTSEEYDKLSDAEKRIIIAKLDGWHVRRVDHGGDFVPYDAWFKSGCGHHIACTNSYLLPDYLHDLNACHEFETQLMQNASDWPYIWYVQELIDLVDRGQHMSQLEKIVHATAEQKCKAFVLAMTTNGSST